MVKKEIIADRLEKLREYLMVHDYLRFDLDRVFGIVTDQVKNFEELAGIYADFL